MKPAPATNGSGPDHVCTDPFTLHDVEGGPTPAFAVATLDITVTFAKGCAAGAFADLGIYSPIEACALFDDATSGRLSADDFASLDEVVAEMTRSVPRNVVDDVAGQMLEMVAGLIADSAVDGVVPAGSSIRLPDAPHFLVDPAEAAGLKPVQILLAVWVALCRAVADARSTDAPLRRTVH